MHLQIMDSLIRWLSLMAGIFMALYAVFALIPMIWAIRVEKEKRRQEKAVQEAAKEREEASLNESGNTTTRHMVMGCGAWSHSGVSRVDARSCQTHTCHACHEHQPPESAYMPEASRGISLEVENWELEGVRRSRDTRMIRETYATNGTVVNHAAGAMMIDAAASMNMPMGRGSDVV